ncbi:hypothetical protein RhiJN_19418 [Ceratobasidium sp. AG-Ba]|nr:hypothetical protein RhiJN_19418 [Ceratobasidium sp. AG-Ba]
MVADDDDHLEEIWATKPSSTPGSAVVPGAILYTSHDLFKLADTYSRSIYYQRNPRYLCLSRLPMDGPVPFPVSLWRSTANPIARATAAASCSAYRSP